MPVLATAGLTGLDTRLAAPVLANAGLTGLVARLAAPVLAISGRVGLEARLMVRLPNARWTAGRAGLPGRLQATLRAERTGTCRQAHLLRYSENIILSPEHALSHQACLMREDNLIFFTLRGALRVHIGSGVAACWWPCMRSFRADHSHRILSRL